MKSKRMKPQPLSLSGTANAILVMTSLPDQTSADELAQYLITEKLAACVNRLAPCHSLYHWQGSIESASEIPLLIKTTEQCYDAVEAAIIEKHPYELPEIIFVSVDGGYPAYLQWIASTIKLENSA
jgi:periplasmic divalent cation tolerance protein